MDKDDEFIQFANQKARSPPVVTSSKAAPKVITDEAPNRIQTLNKKEEILKAVKNPALSPTAPRQDKPKKHQKDPDKQPIDQ